MNGKSASAGLNPNRLWEKTGALADIINPE